MAAKAEPDARAEDSEPMMPWTENDDDGGFGAEDDDPEGLGFRLIYNRFLSKSAWPEFFVLILMVLIPVLSLMVLIFVLSLMVLIFVLSVLACECPCA